MSTGTRKPGATPGRQRPKGSTTPKGKRPPARPARRSRRRTRGVPTGVKLAGGLGLIVVALLGIFLLANKERPQQGDAGAYAYQVGTPGPGSPAPAIRLPSSRGGTFDLAADRGQTVLLYFQEGLGCQPCWDQLRDIERQFDQYKALGITRVVSITTDPLDATKQKVNDEGLSSPVLSDPDLRVSQAYRTNQYGMMGTSRNGHTFIVVGPDGRIRWRADYGGAPNYTMYVPTPNLLADLRKGLEQAPS